MLSVSKPDSCGGFVVSGRSKMRSPESFYLCFTQNSLGSAKMGDSLWALGFVLINTALAVKDKL